MDRREMDALVRMMRARGVAEFTYRKGETDVELTVRFQPIGGAPSGPATLVPGTLAPAALPPPAAPKPAEGRAIKAPIVGTFYRSPAPEAPSYVNLGDRVRKGQVVCIVEAMKLMNQIESDIDGIVGEILIENGQPVQFGQELFRLTPG